MTNIAITFNTQKTQYSVFARFLQIICGSLFLAFCAQIKIPLYFTPVPITLQTFAIMLLGGVLGKKGGTLAVLAYLTEITIGLPFTASGVSNPLALFSPTGGYMVGWLVQVYCIGWMVEKNWMVSRFKTFIALCLISKVQMLIGAAWLSKFVGLENALMAGFYPFLLGDFAKCFAVTHLLNARTHTHAR